MRTGADIIGLWSYGMPFPHLYIGGAERYPGTQSLGEGTGGNRIPKCIGSFAIYAAHGGPLLVEKQKADLGKGNEYTFAVALDRTACRKGHIEIVGAGPGDPDLISIRGRQCWRKRI